MFAVLRFAVVVLIAATAVPVCPQTPGEPARDLVRDAIYNELHDRERDSHWQYRSERVSTAEDVVREQIETDQGPIFMILAQQGKPLAAEQQEREEERLDAYVQSPEQIARVEREHEEDENRLAGVMEMLPRAFLFEYEGETNGDLQSIGFSPDPAYAPSGYEARIVHALKGTLTVNARLKRMVEMRGVLAQRVDFGYGLLGHVDKDGTFEIHRLQVSAEHWKTDRVEVRVEGKILLLKTVGRNQCEVRSDFRPVPRGTTLEEARERMSEAADRRAQAQLAPGPVRPRRVSSTP